MELLVQLVERFSEVWRAVNHAPMPFSAVGITISLLGMGLLAGTTGEKFACFRH